MSVRPSRKYSCGAPEALRLRLGLRVRRISLSRERQERNAVTDRAKALYAEWVAALRRSSWYAPNPNIEEREDPAMAWLCERLTSLEERLESHRHAGHAGTTTTALDIAESLSVPGPQQDCNPDPDRGWRVGRKVGRTIYLDGKLVGLMDTPELAAMVVAALRGAGK